MFPPIFHLSSLVIIVGLYSVSAIPLEQFYQFGPGTSDAALPPNDDGASTPIALSRVFPFYQTDHFSIIVNNNGILSFELPVHTFTPVPFPFNGSGPGTFLGNFQLIAPFWGDVDTRGSPGGNVWFRESAEQEDLNRARDDIRDAYMEAARFTPRSVFIATWDRVGYFSSKVDKTNTFQCVLATDGFLSFVIFLYADGLIQWTTGDASGGTDGLGGTPAQVGFNAGDETTFYSHPTSQTAGVINIDRATFPENLNRTGVLIFRVDQETVGVECMTDTETAVLTLTPPLGNQLGGTPVLVSGFCLNETTDRGKISCIFDGISYLGTYVSPTTVLCATPIMSTAGDVNMTLRIFRRQNRPTISARFKNISPVRAHQVKFTVPSNTDDMQLYFKAKDTVTLSWMPEEVVPSYATGDIDITGIKLDIQLYQQVPDINDRSVSDWVPIEGTLMSSIINDGSEVFIVPTGLRIKNCPAQNEVCPVAFRVSAERGITIGDVTLPSQNDVGIWSGVGYLQSDSSTDASLLLLCNKWALTQNNAIPSSILENLPTCPPTRDQASRDRRFREEQLESVAATNMDTGYASGATAFYHPEVSNAVCYLQVVMEGSINKEGHQCCYNGDGLLVINEPGGGSADKISPFIDYNMHSMNDLLPYAFCCRVNCTNYYTMRPSVARGAAEYELPVPACVFGDPHIVTLDSFKYTFNGKGEFILIETHDNSFTTQGRMEQALDSSGNQAPGTVFTAIVAQQRGAAGMDDGGRVEYQVNQLGELDILVDGRRVNFADSAEQEFRQVVVTDRGNNTVIAEFSLGSNIEVRVENRIISVMLITLPSRYRSLTRGLMGNYNRRTQDDLIPRGGNSPIPMDSSVEEIFSYGTTWMIDDASESLFAYNRPGDNFNVFRDPFFVPAFEPIFDDVELEQKADEICGDDQFCRFDIAATKNEEIGMSTMMGLMDFNVIEELATPITCNPSCVSGVCVDTDTCFCSAGYSGERCDMRAATECEVNMCQNDGVCTQYVSSFTCECPEGYIGIFCQDKEPPFSVRLINSSPRIIDNKFAADFSSSKRLRSAECSIIRNMSMDCTMGIFRHPGTLIPGYYVFRIIAFSIDGERVVERRRVTIGDKDTCVVNLINEGMTVNENCLYFHFRGSDNVERFYCRLDNGVYELCQSPFSYCDQELATYRFQIRPAGKCTQFRKLSHDFTVV